MLCAHGETSNTKQRKTCTYRIIPDLTDPVLLSGKHNGWYFTSINAPGGGFCDRAKCMVLFP